MGKLLLTAECVRAHVYVYYTGPTTPTKERGRVHTNHPTNFIPARTHASTPRHAKPRHTIPPHTRTQAYHDARVSVRRSGKRISAPQTVEQVAVVQQLLATNEAVYATITSKGGKPTSAHSTVLDFPKLRGRGVPLPLPPRIQRLEDEPEEPEYLHLPDADDDKEAAGHLRSVVSFPPIHVACPPRPCVRNLRPPTNREEEALGEGRASRLRERFNQHEQFTDQPLQMG